MARPKALTKEMIDGLVSYRPDQRKRGGHYYLVVDVSYVNTQGKSSIERFKFQHLRARKDDSTTWEVSLEGESFVEHLDKLLEQKAQTQSLREVVKKFIAAHGGRDDVFSLGVIHGLGLVEKELEQSS